MKNLTLAQVQFYGDGIFRWMQSEGIGLTDLRLEGKVYKLLTLLYESPLKEYVDPDFNGMSFDALCKFLNIDIYTRDESTE